MIMISIVCPVFNEAAVIDTFIDAITNVMASLDDDYELLFINDGSTDETLSLLIERQKKTCTIKIIDFSRNFGKEAALTAGLDHARGDAVIPIDVDLQDPPELIPQMVELWRGGYEVVLPKRVDRSQDTVTKRASANWFYKFHNKIAHTPIPENVGDFRLLDRKVVNAIKQLPEKQRFMKGLFAWVGFKTTEVSYERQQRIAGETTFSTWKLWNLAIEGITGFSTLPLRVWSYIGAIISTLAFIYGSLIVLRTIIYGIDLPGYASLLTVTLFLGGIQLIGLGILGEYIGRIYLETKSRPLYIVKQEY